jgi:hypothetical protein
MMVKAAKSILTKLAPLIIGNEISYGYPGIKDKHMMAIIATLVKLKIRQIKLLRSFKCKKLLT